LPCADTTADMSTRLTRPIAVRSVEFTKSPNHESNSVSGAP
jgi:hypothetical protein